MKNYSKLGLFKSKGRLFFEPENKYRTAFQRDRDRIIHSASFRRLKHKTQVFVNTEGDHYRTRITHSIEVAQIARSIARYLNLNDDLAETLSLAHDLGHTPFGHAGESALNDCMSKYGGFDHNLQTLRIVMFLEHKYLKFKGLNLTIETLDGLIKHNGKIVETSFNYDLSDNFIFDLNKNPSLEAQIASLSDDIAYIAHDFDDGIRAEILEIKKIANLSDLFDFIDFKYMQSLDKKVARNYFTRSTINYFVKDLISQTELNLKSKDLKSYQDVINQKNFLVSFSPLTQSKINLIKKYLYENFYTSDFVYQSRTKAEQILLFIIKFLEKDQTPLPNSWRSKIQDEDSKKQIIVEYICGMTDQYAINFYNNYA